MEQLSGLDATFLYAETPEQPMHVGGLMFFDIPKEWDGKFYDRFVEFFKSRVHLIPIFSKKLARAAFNMDHPGWIDVPDLDWDYHIKNLKIAKPGTRAQVEDAVAHFHAKLLPRNKPLWQLHVFEDLENGKAALYSKVHHACIDGQAGMAINAALYDLTPEPRKVPPPKPKKATPEKPPLEEKAASGAVDLMANLARQQLDALEMIPKAVERISGLVMSGGKDFGLPKMLAPRTPFNVSLSQKRSYAARSISLTTLKQIKKISGATVNDIVMAVSSGAMRKYLDDRGKLPKQTMTAFVPISTRAKGDANTNNQVSGMMCSLASDIENPAERLKEISKAAKASKTMASMTSDISPKDFTLVGAPVFLPVMSNLFSLSKLADILPSSANVCISNTMGPPVPLYCAGAKVETLYPVSIPAHGVGLNITVSSYQDKLDFGLTASQNAAPDIDELADLFEWALDELHEAVETQGTNA